MSGSPPVNVPETAFEKRRGINKVEVRTGYAQVHVSRLDQPITESRLQVLGAVADGGITLDFLKLTQSGLSCLVAQENAETVSRALTSLGVNFTVRDNRHILLVHAVNMRDEEGLISRILLESIASGVQIDHVSDMHDRMLVVVSAEDSPKLRQHFEEKLMGVALAH